MDEYVKYLEMELKRYMENKNVILNNIRSIKLDIEQFEIRIKDFNLSKNSGEKLFLGFNNNFDDLESAKLSETKKQLEEQLITLNNKLNFNNEKIEELNHIKEFISNKYIIDNSTIDIIKDKLRFIASFISTDTNRAFVELNQLCDNIQPLLINSDKSSNVVDNHKKQNQKELFLQKGLFDSVSAMINQYITDSNTISTSFSGEDSIITDHIASMIVFILNDLLGLYSSEYDNLKILIHVLNVKVRLIIIENENNILIKLDFPF